MKFGQRASSIAAGVLWAFVYGAFFEAVRVLIAEKLPQLHRLDELERDRAQLVAECDELAALNAVLQEQRSGLFLASEDRIRDALMSSAREESTRHSEWIEWEATNFAKALVKSGWQLHCPPPKLVDAEP